MALIDYGILRQQQQPDFVGAAEAGIRLRDLLALSPIQREQQMLQNASQALANQQQGIALSALMQRQPLDMAEAVLKNQQLQQTVSETERKAQEDAEINRIAQKYLNPQTGEMNYDGFMAELSSRFPIRANEMKGFIYGPQARSQAADFKPVGSPVKGNDGYYYQQYFDSKTKESEWRKTDFKAPEQKVSGGATKPQYITDPETGAVYAVSGTKATPVTTAEGGQLKKEIKAPKGMSSESARSYSIVMSLNDGLDELQSKMTSGDFQKNAAAVRVPGSDLNRLVSNVVDLLGKKRSGAALSQMEEELYQNLLSRNYDAVLNNKEAFRNQIQRLKSENKYFIDALKGEESKGIKEQSKQEPQAQKKTSIPRYDKRFEVKKRADGTYWQNLNGKITQVQYP